MSSLGVTTPSCWLFREFILSRKGLKETGVSQKGSQLMNQNGEK